MLASTTLPAALYIQLHLQNLRPPLQSNGLCSSPGIAVSLSSTSITTQASAEDKHITILSAAISLWGGSVALGSRRGTATLGYEYTSM